MAEVIKRRKALSVNPLKASQTLGAALAFLGFDRAIPMLHGSQGCSAFGKVYFVRHFREPVPLQTTALDQVSTIMGGDESIVAGLDTLCRKSRPGLVGLVTTGLTETQGADVARALKEFRAAHPEHDQVPVVPVAAPDYKGSLESGWAAAVQAVIESRVPPAAEAGTRPGRRPRQVNLLPGAALTPADVEALKELVEAFGLRPVAVPDLSDSLDGHLAPEDFSPLTTGGTPVGELAHLGDAAATLVVGASMANAADLLRARTGVPDHRFDHLLGLEGVDALVLCLHRIAGVPVPERVERQRAQLQDAMLDAHFMLGFARFAIAAEPDLLQGLAGLLAGMGAKTVAAVAPANAPVLARVPCEAVQIGDLEDLEQAARAAGAEVLIGSSHAAQAATRLGLPLVRAGFPQVDRLGGHAVARVGYRGSRTLLFELANVLLEREQGGADPYQSIFAPRHGERREVHHGPAEAPARAGHDA